jgi:hypothetical protein
MNDLLVPLLQEVKGPKNNGRGNRNDMRRLFSLIVFMVGLFMIASHVFCQDKQIVGWLERVKIYPGSLVLKAKLDTGAKNCSLNAQNIVEFERNGEKWVRFDLVQHSGKRVTMESKMLRVAKIKMREGEPQKRISISLGICLGSLLKEAEVNLTNRSNFNYPMLIGRNFIQDDFIVDPSLKYSVEPSCSEVFRR